MDRGTYCSIDISNSHNWETSSGFCNTWSSGDYCVRQWTSIHFEYVQEVFESKWTETQDNYSLSSVFKRIGREGCANGERWNKENEWTTGDTSCPFSVQVLSDTANHHRNDPGRTFDGSKDSHTFGSFVSKCSPESENPANVAESKSG